MRVKVLEAIHYPPDSSHWEALEMRDPDWASIETAIRRLERNEWPYVWLHTAEPVEGETPENALAIMGGRGEYSLFLLKGGADSYFCDQSRGEALIRVW